MLTVDETLGVLFLNEPSCGLINHANPRARQAVRAFVETFPLTEHHENGLLMLGALAHSEDALWLENQVTQRRLFPYINDFEGVFVIQSIVSLGMMSRRGNRDAQRILEEMASVKYWRRAGVIWFPDGPTGFWTQELNPVRFVLIELKSTQISQDKLASITRLVYEDLDHEKAREKFLMWHGPEWLRMPNPSFFVDRRELTDEEIGIRVTVAKRWNGDLKNPRPSAIVGGIKTLPPVPDALPKPLPTPPEYIEFVSNLALQNYAEISKIVRGGKTAEIVPKLAKHGHPMSPTLLKRPGAEQQFASFLKMQTKLQDTVGERKIKPVFDRIRREAVVQDGRLVEWLEIRHRLPGTADIAPKSDQPETFDADGSLVILMRRVDGQWYWQPFGW